MPALSVTMHTRHSGNQVDRPQWTPCELRMAIIKSIKVQKHWNAEGVHLVGNVSINQFAKSRKYLQQKMMNCCKRQ